MANSKAAEAFLKENAQGLKDPNTLDLHFLYVKALKSVDHFLDININILRRSSSKTKDVKIITGRGNNSEGKPKLKLAVQGHFVASRHLS